MKKNSFVLLLVFFSGLPLPSVYATSEKVPPPVLKTLKQLEIPASSLSIYVHDVDKNKPLLSVNGDVSRSPASVIKLLTTFVALDTLTPAYLWKTSIYATGKTRRGRLQGNLIVKGSGDPFLVTEHFWKLLQGVRQRGIREIRGNLILDNSIFAVPPEDPAEFDGKPYRSYNVSPQGLLLNFKATTFTFRSDPQNKRVRIISDPPNSEFEITNNIKLSNRTCRRRYRHISTHVLDNTKGKIRFSGTFPSSCPEVSFTRAIGSHKNYIFGVFKALWKQMGGTFKGTVQLGGVPQNAQHLFSVDSKPLSEVIRGMNKYSNNVMTRQLLLTLGAETGAAPGTEQKGVEAIQLWLQNNGIRKQTLILDNGAGLSRKTRISSNTLGAFLVAAYKSPFMPEFVSSLPISAMDGSLRKRFQDEPLAGMLHVKTGLLDHVRSLAGYMRTESGKTLVVVAIQNYPNIHQGLGTRIQDQLLRWLYRR
ncbi:D-alanyl-D-alanine carboxypeptidase/D-alanyl-D-alanine-endopeptidase [Pseudomonadota bacterium]